MGTEAASASSAALQDGGSSSSSTLRPLDSEVVHRRPFPGAIGGGPLDTASLEHAVEVRLRAREAARIAELEAEWAQGEATRAAAVGSAKANYERLEVRHMFILYMAHIHCCHIRWCCVRAATGHRLHV